MSKFLGSKQFAYNTVFQTEIRHPGHCGRMVLEAVPGAAYADAAAHAREGHATC